MALKKRGADGAHQSALAGFIRPGKQIDARGELMDFKGRAKLLKVTDLDAL